MHVMYVSNHDFGGDVGMSHSKGFSSLENWGETTKHDMALHPAYQPDAVQTSAARRCF